MVSHCCERTFTVVCCRVLSCAVLVQVGLCVSIEASVCVLLLLVSGVSIVRTMQTV